MSRNPRYIVILAIASGLILGIGTYLKPEDRVSEPVSAPSQTESRLPSRALRRNLEETAEFFGEVAADFSRAVVRLRSVRRTGVVWSQDRVVSARLGWRFPAAVTVATGDGDVGAYTTVAGPHLPLAAMRTPLLSGREPPVQRPAGSLEPGEWVLALWHTEDRFAYAPGSYLGTSARPCGELRVEELVTSLPIKPTMLGGGLFDLDGGLVGMMLLCDDEALAVTADSVAELLAAGQTHDGRLHARWGLRVEPLTGPEAFHFGLGNGLVVRELWDRYPGVAAGLRPGDVLVTLDGVALRAVDDLRVLDEHAAANQETFALELRRGLERLTIWLPARGIDTQLDTSEPATAGLVWEESARGYLIAGVLPGTRAADVGIEPGDRLVRIDHQEPESLEDVRGVLAEDRVAPAFIELARDGRAWGVLLR